MGLRRKGNGSHPRNEELRSVLKFLLAAVVVVAGFIGISGIFPQVIDARWTPDPVPRLPVMSLSTPDARTKALDDIAKPESPSRRVVTTGEGTSLLVGSSGVTMDTRSYSFTRKTTR